MSGFTPAEQLHRLAAAAREPVTPETVPSPIVFVRLCAIAQARGVPWARIAQAVGAPNGKVAKRWAKQQAALAQRRWLAREVLQASVCDQVGAA